MVPILVFDIETIPDVAGIRALNGLPAELGDDEVAREMDAALDVALDDEVLLAGEINDNPAEFVLGRVNGNDATKLLGALDQVMVFSRALEAEELCELAGPLCNTP